MRRLMTFITHTSLKLKSRSGETLAETLIAVLISALALVLLLTMITGSSRLIQNGEAKMKEMYEGSVAIEQKTAAVTENVTVTIKDNNSLSTPLSDMTVTVNVYTDDKSSLSSYECAE